MPRCWPSNPYWPRYSGPGFRCTTVCSAYFDRADNAFVSAYRKHRKGEDGFDIEVEYLSQP
jgi:hypothetical protein